MRTENQVIDFIKSETNNGNSIVYATIGNGGAGLTVSSFDFTKDLEGMDFAGKVEPCDDIKGWPEYDTNMYSVYQFGNDKGLKYQIVTF